MYAFPLFQMYFQFLFKCMGFFLEDNNIGYAKLSKQGLIFDTYSMCHIPIRT